MNEPINRPPPESHDHHGHETTDVGLFSIGLFASGLVLMIAVVLPLLGWMFWSMEAAAKRAELPQSPFSEPPTFRGPKLQEQPSSDLVSLRRAEDQRLTTYGWIDRQQKIVRIPIELAMQILAERGLPEPAGTAEPVREKEIAP
jgi:hypothetical protein